MAAATSSGRNGYRDVTLILVAHGHGLRAIEIAKLESSQVEFGRAVKPAAECPVMGFNKRRMERERAAVAAKEAEARRALGPQISEDSERLVASWNARQEAHMPMLFSPTIGVAIAAKHWFLWVRCPACRTINAIDLRTLDRHPDSAITSLIPWLSCRSCRPHAPFAELVRLSPRSMADEMREEHRRSVSRD